MRVMHVIDTLRLGGAERMLVDLANRASEEGDKVAVVVTRHGTQMAPELRPAIRLAVLQRKRRLDVRAMRQFTHLVNTQRVELLHVHGRSSFSFVAVLKAMRFVQAPVLLHDHYGKIELDSTLPLWFRAWGRHLLGYYVGVCPKLLQAAEAAGVPAKKTAVISNALNLDRIRTAKAANLRREFSVPEGTLIGLVVAGIRPEKGILEAMEAVASCRSGRPFRLIILGGERDQDYSLACRRQREALGLQEQVIFGGERADVPSLIRGADFALIPALSESGPLVLLEYMAGRLPFVATRVGDIAGQVSERGVPEFVAPGDSSALAAALCRLLSLSDAERQRRAQLSERVALQHFDVRSAMRQWRKVYQRTLQYEPA